MSVANESLQNDRPGPWEAFLNHTFNGRYWAIRRENPSATVIMDGYEVMLMARSHHPRRFGSQEAAQRAADAANAENGQALTLTAKQRQFLASYIPDICHGFNKRLWRANESEFMAAVCCMEFDGREQSGDVRIARSLFRLGLFERFTLHSVGSGERKAQYLHIQFNARGAKAIFAELCLQRNTPEFQQKDVLSILLEADEPMDADQVASVSQIMSSMEALHHLDALCAKGRACKVDCERQSVGRSTYEASSSALNV